MLDTISQRFAMLEPHLIAYGPDDGVKRPAVLLFHACNGVREHIHDYARQAADLGMRAFVVDSFKPRGWDYTAAVSLVCSGLALHGYERSGDVLAAVWGLSQRPEVDADRLVLAGWSHGGWSIMDLMAQKLARSGEARLADPDPHVLAGVRGLFLVYPYINVPALSATHAWTTRPKTLAVLAERDFLTPHHHAVSVLGHLRDEGAAIETVTLNATHCFDEDGIHFGPLMAYDPAAHDATQAAFTRFLKSVE